MQKYRTLILGIVIAFALAAASASAWNQIPDTAHIAVHFDMSGTPDSYWSKTMALSFTPALILGWTILFAVLRTFHFKGWDWVACNHVALDVGYLAPVTLVAAGHILIVLHAEGRPVDIGGVMVPLVGLVFLVLGNFLGKTQRNLLVGVRSRWTLASEYVWERTNRVGGRLIVALGLVTLLTDAVASNALALKVLVIGAILLAVTLWTLSWLYSRQDPTHTAQR